MVYNEFKKMKTKGEMKKLKIKEVSSILKKYVASKDTRPVLQNASVTENHIIATDSHQLVRINRSIVESEFFVNETKLFDPKSSTYNNLEANYPDTSRLIPNSSNAELTITVDNIKRSIEVINYLQHISGNKKNTIVNVVTYNNELVFGCFICEEGEQSEFYQTGIESNEDISVNVNGEFFKTMLNTFKKVLKTIGQTKFKMNFIGALRPMLFETANKELEILVLPIRTDMKIKDITIAENQDVTIEKKVTIKSVVKRVVLFVSGIVRKKAVEHEQINDFMTYLLKEDVTSVENETDQETKERRYNNLMLFAEIDGHLFHVGRIANKDKLREYNKSELIKLLKESHKEGLEAGRKVSAGMTQYLEAIEEDQTEKQYNSEGVELQAENEGYLQHFSSNTVEIEEENEKIPSAAVTTNELKQELNDIDNRLNKGVTGEELDGLKLYSGELRVNINKSLDQLFHNDSITEAQNGRINMLLNEWINNDKYTFVSLYKELNNSGQICLHVAGDTDLYVWFDVNGVRVYSNSFVDNVENKLKLINEFEYNTISKIEHVNIEDVGTPAKEKNAITEQVVTSGETLQNDYNSQDVLLRPIFETQYNRMNF